MDSQPIDYDLAAIERLQQARDLYRKETRDVRTVNRHSLAFYAAGVAVECMLRAFITRKSREFEGRHNLVNLLQSSGLLSLDQAKDQLRD